MGAEGCLGGAKGFDDGGTEDGVGRLMRRSKAIEEG